MHRHLILIVLFAAGCGGNGQKKTAEPEKQVIKIGPAPCGHDLVEQRAGQRCRLACENEQRSGLDRYEQNSTGSGKQTGRFVFHLYDSFAGTLLAERRNGNADALAGNGWP